MEGKSGKRKAKKILIATVCVLLAAVLCTALYFGDYYHAEGSALDSFKASDDGVAVSEIDEGWLFDGPGTGHALIFYPGAKVEAEAYGPLMREIAEEGVDCFLCRMPLNFALADIDRAEKIREDQEYDHWFIGGHSLGGVAAAMNCDSGSGYDGLILLASYADRAVGVPEVLTVFGSEDGVLDMDGYRAAFDKNYYPDDTVEVVIEGGNHAMFGDYGEQKGDGAAKISAEEQKKQTAEAVAGIILDR